MSDIKPAQEPPQSVPEPSPPVTPPTEKPTNNTPTHERDNPVTQPQPYPQQPHQSAYAGPPVAPPVTKKRHIFRWVFLAVQALFLIWIIGGVSSTSGSCEGEVGDMLDACQAGTAVGAGIGVALIIGLWVAVDIILGITWLIVRKR